MLGIVLSAFDGETGANGQVATFENFPEGVVGSGSFLDPTSGIVFTNDNTAEAVFCVDHYGLVSPPALPSKLLTGKKWTPGGSVWLAAGFEFTCLLPNPSAYVQMDMIYASNSTLPTTVAGYAADGQQVLITNVMAPSVVGVSVLHLVCVSAAPMKRVVVDTPTYFTVAFDNVGAPPVIESIFTTHQTVTVSVRNGRPESQLFYSTNLATWSSISAQATNDSGCTIFSAPMAEPQAFFRVQW